MGSRAIVVRGGEHLDRSGVMGRLRGMMAGVGVEVVEHVVLGEPEVTAVDEALRVAREARSEMVIGLGGGSALDAAKAVAGLLTMGGEALDYMEVVGRGRPIDRPSAPLVAVPTTAGTGTEVTRNAVLAYEPARFKASMRSLHLIPRMALVDPQLTDSVPAAVTASTGLDALTQLIEPYVSKGATPITDGLALEGMGLAGRSLRRAFLDGGDELARDEMSLASLLGGVCWANGGWGAVHGFAAPLGAMFPIPHGTACAALLAPVMEANVGALREQGVAGSAVLSRYGRIGEVLTARRYATVDEAIDAGLAFVRELVAVLGIPGLGQYGLGGSDFGGVVEAARRASSMKYNPVVLTEEVLLGCLSRAA
jgi:alcohol dehydrogenase class IV